MATDFSPLNLNLHTLILHDSGEIIQGQNVPSESKSDCEILFLQGNSMIKTNKYPGSPSLPEWPRQTLLCFVVTWSHWPLWFIY